MVFSTNQVIQFYNLSATGTNAAVKEGAEFFYIDGLKNGAGEDLRSDLIPVGGVKEVRLVDAGALQIVPKVKTVTINSVVAGQDYIVRLTCQRGLDGSGTKVIFTGLGRATSSSTATTVAAEIAEALNKTQLHQPSKYFVATAAAGVITITPSDPDWLLGQFQLTAPSIEVSFAPIIDANGNTVYDWATVAESDGTAISDGKVIADLEYFALGELGADDVHGCNIISADVKKTVVPGSAYHVLSVQYYRTLPNDGVQKSERTLILVGTTKPTTLAKNIAKAGGLAKYVNIALSGKQTLEDVS